jgi:hypothetical protein
MQAPGGWAACIDDGCCSELQVQVRCMCAVKRERPEGEPFFALSGGRCISEESEAESEHGAVLALAGSRRNWGRVVSVCARERHGAVVW